MSVHAGTRDGVQQQRARMVVRRTDRFDRHVKLASPRSKCLLRGTTVSAVREPVKPSPDGLRSNTKKSSSVSL